MIRYMKNIRLQHIGHPERPLRAGERGRFEFIITVEEDIPKDGQAAFCFPANWTVPQVINGLSDGILKVASNHPMLYLRVMSDRFKHTVVLINKGSMIRAQDTIVLRYGDLRNGRPGAAVPGHAREYKGDEIESSFAFRIEPGAPAGVYCSASPAIAPVGENVRLVCNIMDNCGNVINEGSYIDRVIWWKLSDKALEYRYTEEANESNSFLHKDLRNETWELHESCSIDESGPCELLKVFRESGVYMAEAEVEGLGRFTGNPVMATTDGNYLIFGDPHVHTERSDGIYPASYAYRYAAEVAGLGFISITDHEGGWFQHDDWHLEPSFDRALACKSSWEGNVRDCEKNNQEGRFIALLGTEWTSGIGYPHAAGHRNIYFPDAKGQPLDPNNPDEDSIEKLYDALRDKECIVVPHHSGVHMQWEGHEPGKQRLVEIYSTWGCSEYPANDLWELDQWQDGFVQEAWKRGLLLGVIAGSDSHITTPGYPGFFNRLSHVCYKPGITGVYTDTFTRSGLFNALYMRRTYGTTGQKIILKFSLNGCPMGSVLEAMPCERVISVFCIGEAPLRRVEVIRNNQVVHVWNGNSLLSRFEWEDKSPVNEIMEGSECKNLFYYIRVHEADGGMAWSSPVWICAD
jgi:hypothetical protein